MSEWDFVFEENLWELALKDVKSGESFCAAKLLTLLEDGDESQAQEAFDVLCARQIALDIRALPKMPETGAASQRLAQELQMVRQGNLMQDLQENDPLRLYLEEVSCIPAAGDPAVLAKKLAEGDTDSMQLLADCMLGQAVCISQEYVGRGVLLLDLMQEASLGLWQGIQCYAGGNFEEHCRWWIRQYLAGAVMLQARSSGIGQKLRQTMEDYRAVDEKLLAELGRNPTMDEIAQALHISEQETAMVAGILENARILQNVKTPEPEALPQEEDQAVENTAYFQMRQRIAELMSGLSQQDAELLSLRYGLEGGLPMNPQQVANRMGFTVQEVIDREAAALAKLRQQNE